LLVAGCTAPSGSTLQPKPGTGIAEYRQIAGEAHSAVAAALEALEHLARSQAETSPPPSTLAGFDRALENLELTSFKTRSRAEAIIARGHAYFEEWKANLASVTNQVAARVETERYERLLGHFNHIQERSGDVRTEFRPFMAKLRAFRAQLDRSATPADREQWRTSVDGLSAGGRRVLESLDAVTKSLGEAETELRTALAVKR
jgi:hypothetical protein